MPLTDAQRDQRATEAAARIAAHKAQNPSPRTATANAPCAFMGEQLTAGEAVRRGLNPLRRWTECDHPEQPLGSAVCACRGCGPNCRVYQGERHSEFYYSADKSH